MVIILATTARVPQDDAALLAELCNQYLAHVAAYKFYLTDEAVMREVPDMSLAHYRREAVFAETMLKKLAAIRPNQLALDDGITHAMLRRDLQAMAAFPEQGYWLEFDVLPYHAGFLLASFSSAARGFLFDLPEDKHAYLKLIDSFTRMVEEQTAKLKAQAKRGILIPKAALPGAIALFESTARSLPEALSLSAPRLRRYYPEGAETYRKTVAARVSDEILPAIEALVDLLKGDYRNRAPETVGLWQYPGGESYYRRLVAYHTTLDLNPEAIHELGEQQVARLAREMAELRRRQGHGDQTAAAYHGWLRKTSVAKSPEEIAQKFNAWIARIEPVIDDHFAVKPKAPYGVKRLDPAAEGGMTFGYYQMPTKHEPKGHYLFNGSNLEERPMTWGAALIYHELIPGHHFHLALQAETESLPLYRRKTLGLTAFNEGWAEYAAWYAGEMGMYRTAQERYGMLLFDMFVSVRLVVDTGLNAKQWSLQKARAYMAKHLIQSEVEIASETLRYGTDLPGQALAYKLGMETLIGMRRQAQKSLGDRFDIRLFHATVLGGGAMPLPLLQRRVDAYIATGKVP